MSFLSWMKSKLKKPETVVEPLPRILQYRRLASDLVWKVFGDTNPWASDTSTLWDFHDDDSNEAYYAKIEEIYGVDVREVEDAKLVDILEKIDREAKIRFWLRDTPDESLVR
jgi:hypothetical protein